MEHVVFFPAPDGTPAFRRLASLEEAVRFVEHLRNVENVSEASVHALTEVPLAFKAWYRVELPARPEPALGEPAQAAEHVQVVEPAPVAAAPSTIAEAIESYEHIAEPAPVPVAAVPEAGSATGIVVPDQPFVAVDQFAAAPLPPVAMAPQESVPAQQPQQGDAQVLEPAFGSRRERGMGFFAR